MNVRVVPHKRGNGKWAIDYHCPVTKKRKYESFGTKREASLRKKKLEGEHASGKYKPLHASLWSEYIDEYRKKVQIGKKPKTRAIEDRTITVFEFHCGPKAIRGINNKMLDEFRAKRSQDPGRQSEKVSAYTVNKELRVLRTLLRKAAQWNYLTEVPRINLVKTTEPEPQAIPPVVFNMVLSILPDWDKTIDRRPDGWKKGLKNGERQRQVRQKAPPANWWTAFLSTAYLSGLRWGELLSLKWQDLQFTSSLDLRVRNEKCNRWDHVPLSKLLAERLQAWMVESPSVGDTELVFPHRCHDRTISAAWNAIQKVASVEEPFRFHDLRVSFCTNLVAAGVEAPLLRKLARHRSLETTMKYYRGRTDLADRKALEMMEASFLLEENVEPAKEEMENVLVNAFSKAG